MNAFVGGSAIIRDRGIGYHVGNAPWESGRGRPRFPGARKWVAPLRPCDPLPALELRLGLLPGARSNTVELDLKLIHILSYDKFSGAVLARKVETTPVVSRALRAV